MSKWGGFSRLVLFSVLSVPPNLPIFSAPALGPRPQRELTTTLRRDGAWPRRSVAAGAPVLPVFSAPALGPHPQRELTLTLRRGVAWPRRSVAAGAPVLAISPLVSAHQIWRRRSGHSPSHR